MADEKKIVCYGDSNTWGACGFTAARRDRERRWCGIIDIQPAYSVVNCGENGREIPHDRISLKAFEVMTAREAPFDLLTVMLGTNDLFNMTSPDAEKITARMEAFLNTALQLPAIAGDGRKVLLVAPPPTAINRAYEDGRYDEISARLGPEYAALAERLGINFANAALWGVKCGPDGVHFSEDGHRAFARGLVRVLDRIFAGEDTAGEG